MPFREALFGHYGHYCRSTVIGGVLRGALGTLLAEDLIQRLGSLARDAVQDAMDLLEQVAVSLI